VPDGDDQQRAPRPGGPSLPRAAWALAGVFGVAMVGLLVVNVVLIAAQLDVVRDQRGVAERQERRAGPLLEATRPLADDLRAALPAAARLTREARPLVPRLSRSARRVDDLTREATPLAAALRADGFAGTAVRAGRLTADLSQALLAAGAPQAAADGRRVSRELLEQRRLRRTLTGALRLMRALERERVVPRTARAARLAPEAVALMRTLVAAQQRSLTILERSLAVQEQTARHAASLDRKIGFGPAP
jgi:hypothetical protein